MSPNVPVLGQKLYFPDTDSTQIFVKAVSLCENENVLRKSMFVFVHISSDSGFNQIEICLLY